MKKNIQIKMGNKLLSLMLLLIMGGNLYADDYYWVNNGGDWTDYENHWSTSSGDTSNMHNSLPGPGDNVYFDANSFSQNSEMVVLDTSFVSLTSFNWAGVAFAPEFLSQSTDTIVIQQSLILSPDMEYNHFGPTFFEAPASSVASFETSGHEIVGDVYFDISDGTIGLPSGINMPQNNLYLLAGTLNANNEELRFKAFNGDKDVPVDITDTPAITNADTIRCNQAFYLHDNMNVASLDAMLFMNLQSSDSCYISFSDNLTALDVRLNGNKKLFMQGPVKTTGNLNLDFSGSFYTNNYDLTCDTLKSNTSLARTFNAGSSQISLTAFMVDGNGLTLESSNAVLSFAGGSEYIYKSGNLNASYAKFAVADARDIFVQSSFASDSLKLATGSAFIVKQGTTVDINGLLANGTCGEFIHVRSYCQDDMYVWPDENCISQMPVINASADVTANYLKIGFVRAQNATVTANNSYAQGNADGWTINQPAQSDTLYWIGNTGYWHDAANWSDTSGGAPQTCVPNPESLVVFDDASFASDGDTVKLSKTAYCRAVTWADVTHNVIWDGNADLNIQDSLELYSGLQADYHGDILFSNSHPSDTFDIYTHGVNLNSNIVFNGEASWRFNDGLISTENLILNDGNLIMENQNVSCARFYADTDNVRNLNLNKADITLTGDNQAWLVNPTNLTFDADSSSLVLQSSNGLLQKFEGGDLNYHDLIALTEETELTGSNSFNLISLQPGNTFWLEPLSVTQTDSLIANGSCDQQIIISSTNTTDTAQFVKSGYDTLQVSSVLLKNITADTTGSVYYEAVASDSAGIVNGWNFTGSLTGKTYYWLGNNSQWSDVANWEVDGNPATCLPGLKDTVVIDSAHLAIASDTILINIDKMAYCYFLDASDTASIPVHMTFNHELVSKTGVDLHNVEMMYPENLSMNSLFDVEHGLRIMPDQNNATISTDSASHRVKLFINPYHPDDTVFLETDIHFSELAGINVVSGTFVGSDKSISAPVFRTSSDANKTVVVESSLLDIEFYWEVQKSSRLDLQADSSLIRLVENSYTNAFFDGGGQQYYDLQIYTSEDNSPVDDYLVSCYGSNSFHNFTVFPGGTVQIEAGSVTTIDSLLSINGTCPDKIRFRSSSSGDEFTFNKTNTSYQDTAYSLLVSDMVINPSAVAMLSTDEGNNTGWIFDPTEAAVADFDMPYPACVESDLTFVNTSQSMHGGQMNLVFEWIVEDTDTIGTTDLEYYFSTQGDYKITLIATDTLTHCYDVFHDTLNLVEHSVDLASTPGNLTICEGETVSFQASSSHTVDYNFYLNDQPLNLGAAVDLYETDTLSGINDIFVEAVLEGCVEYSDTLDITVNPLPNALVSVSPSDTSICDGEAIGFTASGADQYQYYVDSSSVTNMSDETQYSTSSIDDLAFVQVYATDTATGCTAWSDDEFTVRVYDNPTIGLSADIDPAEICDGETLGFTATGAVEYEFFVNGVSQGAPTSDNTFSSDILQDGDLVTVEGYNINGCSSVSDFVNVTVNPAPNTTLTSDADANSICEGEEITFSGSGAVEYLFFIDSVAQGSWSPQESLASSSVNHEQVIGLAGRIGDCYDTASNITINVYPDIQLSADTLEICEGEQIVFTATGDTIYQFYIDGIPVGPESSDNQYVSSSLSDGQTVSVTGTPNACEPEALDVIVHPLPEPALSCSDADTSICEGNEITFTGTGAELYEFFVNDVSQGPASDEAVFSSTDLNDGDTVSMNAFSEFGCFAESEDVYVFEVKPYPDVNLFSADPTEICEGDTVLVEGSGADIYEFFLNGESLDTPASESSMELTGLSNMDEISLEGTTNGCTSSSTETLNYTVYNLPNVTVSAGSPLSVCEGEPITILATGASEYEFLVNGVSQGAPDSDSEFVSDMLNNGDVISAVGYQNICSDTSQNSIEVNVNEIPDPVFTTNMSAEGTCLNDTLHFDVTGAQTFEFFVDGLSQGTPGTDSVFTMPQFVDGQIVSVYGYNNSCVREADTAYTISVNHVDVEVSITPESTAVCGAQEITAQAEGADLYEFFLDGASTGAASENNSYDFTVNNDGMTVSVEGTDTVSGCQERSAHIYFNQTAPPVITPEAGVFCEHDSVSLQSSASENNQWFRNDDPVPGANGDTYFARLGGEYTVQLIEGDEKAVFAGGENAYGQLGTGNTVQSDVPVQALTDAGIIKLASGREFVLALDEESNLWAWGNNDYGSLGDGSYSHSYEPQIVPGLSSATAVAAGYYHAIALMADSSLMAWGRNDDGQLGYGNTAASNFPNAVQELSGIVAVAAGESHSLALDADGKVYAWGKNQHGQLGSGDNESLDLPHMIDNLDNIQSIACGANHNFAIDSDGRLYGWGANSSGQLGTYDMNNRLEPAEILALPAVKLVAAGKQHSLVYNENGYVYAMGDNSHGQLGVPGVSGSSEPVLVDINGGIVKLAAAPSASYAIRNDKSLWAWGQNGSAQLLLGTSENVTEPQRSELINDLTDVSGGINFTAALREDAAACSSEPVSIEMLNVPEVEIQRDGLQLFVTEGESWQWFLNGSMIPGETGSSLDVSAEGDYTVLIGFDNGCAYETEPFEFALSVEDYLSDAFVSVLPNPSDGKFMLTLNMPVQLLDEINGWEVYTPEGKSVERRTNFTASPEQKIDLRNLKPGMYYMKLENDIRPLVIKLVIR